MRGLYVGLLISLIVALVAGESTTTDTSDDDLLGDQSTLRPANESNSTGNPAEGFKIRDRWQYICGENEIWGKCGKVCEKTCKHRGLCLVKLCDSEWDGCHCKLGYVRNRKKKCVRPWECKMCNGSNRSA